MINSQLSSRTRQRKPVILHSSYTRNYKQQKTTLVKYKPGDKVSFLNEKGGGIITRISDDNILYVTIADGFEIPVMSADVIKTGSSAIEENLKGNYSSSSGQLQEEEEEDQEFTPLNVIPNNKEQRAEGIYFAIVPDIQNNPLTGSLDLYLVNRTGWNVLFNLFQNYEGAYHGADYGFIKEEAALHLGSIGRSEIEKWSNALCQFVFFMEGKTTPLTPFSGLIHFRPVKIYKEDSFVWESLMRKKAYFTSIVELSALSKKSLFEEKNDKETIRIFQEKFKEQKPKEPQKPAAPKSFLDKHKIDDRIAEVDLHIGELVDDFTNLEKSDLLRIQLDYVDKCLDQAMKERLSKIVFIHGVGNGILKTEVNKMLQRTDNIEFYDASYARYGMGATEVKFFHSKNS